MSPRQRPTEPPRLLFGADQSAVWLVAIVGLSLSFAALLLIREQLQAHKMLDFQWVAYNRIRALDHGLDNSVLAVTTPRDHVIASGGVDGERFQVFAESLLARHRGVQALMWVPLIDGAERAIFEAPASQGKTEFRVWERSGHLELVAAAERAEYFPVTHLAPERVEGIPAGFNLGSVPRFAETLSRARDQRRTAASARIAYPAPGGGIEYGFMVASPVFGDNTPVQTADPRPAVLLGFAVGFFRLGNLTNAAISLLEPRGVEILILDESVPNEEHFLHFYASRLAPRDVGPDNFEGWWNSGDQPRVAERVQMADRQLAIVCGRSKVFRKSTTRQFQYSADDGTYWEGRIVPIRSGEGPVTAAMVIAADVTEKRNLEAQALHNARLASIGVLAAGVAHEINNPNNAIQFNASLISRAWGDVTPILREYFEENGDFALGGLSFSEARDSFPRLLSEITGNSDRIRRIVQNLKHMSRQDTGEMTESVDIQQVLEAATMILHNQIQKFTDDCTLEVPGGTCLGLSISRSIVEKHGGSMGFESVRGSGTTVTIRIPVIPSA